MNAFALPEEAMPYSLPVFPKPAEKITEYADQEGSVDYLLRTFDTNEPYRIGEESTPVVQPVLFQDFKEVLPPSQA
jgi:hypothetical protein